MSESQWVFVDVVGVKSADGENILLLLDPVGEVLLPILVGSNEAAAITSAYAERAPARPMTHDLLYAVVEALGSKIERVEITHLEHGVFHARLVFENNVVVDSRASDAVAIAVRAGVPVTCAREILTDAGIKVEVSVSAEDIDAFRNFLEEVNADDFDQPSGSPGETRD